MQRTIIIVAAMICATAILIATLVSDGPDKEFVPADACPNHLAYCD